MSNSQISPESMGQVISTLIRPIGKRLRDQSDQSEDRILRLYFSLFLVFSFDFATNYYQSHHFLINNYFLWKFGVEPRAEVLWLVWVEKKSKLILWEILHAIKKSN